MRLNTFNKSLILLIITTLILVIILTFSSFAKNFISRLIFSHDLSLLTKTIIKQIDINTTFDVYDKFKCFFLHPIPDSCIKTIKRFHDIRPKCNRLKIKIRCYMKTPLQLKSYNKNSSLIAV